MDAVRGLYGVGLSLLWVKTPAEIVGQDGRSGQLSALGLLIDPAEEIFG